MYELSHKGYSLAGSLNTKGYIMRSLKLRMYRCSNYDKQVFKVSLNDKTIYLKETKISISNLIAETR